MGEPRRTLLLLGLFALAMAHVEASLVVHLRDLYYPGDPLRLFPLALLSRHDLVIELVRETATLVMILSVALLAARGPGLAFAAFCYVFGLWDLGYYLWLKLMLGWPVNWLEWDVLFLIPWPWFGPWLAPVLIAVLFVVWCVWAMAIPKPVRFSVTMAVMFVLGALLALCTLLLPALPLLQLGEQAFRGYVPESFSWPLYLAGYLLMAGALAWIVAQAKKD